MTSRWAGFGVLAAAGVAGMAFASVFGAWGLLPPVLAVLVPVAVVDLSTRGRLVALRAPLGLLTGAGAGVGALAAAAGTAPVLAGLRDGWLRTLESTQPARADPDLMAFVPALVLLSGVLGLEWLRRDIPPLLTLVPSAAVLVVAQLYRAATGGQAVALACAYGLAAATVLGTGARGRSPGLATLGALALLLVLTGAGGAVALVVLDPVGRPAFSAADRYAAAGHGAATNPLAELGGRLTRPDHAVFTVRTSAAVDRWPLVVLDRFDGATFTSSARYRLLGSELPSDPAVTVPTVDLAADVAVDSALDGPWLPTQFRTLAIEGARPVVDPLTGTLVHSATERAAGYRVRWRAPALDRDHLVDAAIDPAAAALQVSEVPAVIADTAAHVLGGAPPSFPAALALEKWFRDNFAVATADELPTGHGTAQLLHFLDVSRRGTSEQFAAAYVLMARSAGIPVRLVVGFRQPAQPEEGGRFVVRNRDVLAWPEVAVAGVGWVALDPTGNARSDQGDSAAAAAQAARDELPGTNLFPVPRPAPTSTAVEPAPTSGAPSLVAGAATVGLLVGGAAAVPVAKRVRRAHRRRGSAAAAVVGAWRETRDRLRDHGAPVSSGMTVRDLRGPATELIGTSGGGGPAAELDRLARCVDTALYSAAAVDRAVADEAWAATSAMDRALAGGPMRVRLRAAWCIATLRPGPRRVRPRRAGTARARAEVARSPSGPGRR